MNSRRLRPATTRSALASLVTLTVLFGGLTLASSAVALPEGRVYEMVSPVFKGGYGADLIQAVPDGGTALPTTRPERLRGHRQGLTPSTTSLIAVRLAGRPRR